MKYVQWFICMTVLLAGCLPTETVVTSSPSPSPPSWLSWSPTFLEGGNFVVDGNTYSIILGHIEKDGSFLSLILAFPCAQHYFPVFTVGENAIKGAIHREENNENKTIGSIGGGKYGSVGIKIADANLCSVYFIDDKQIVFHKSNEELGIDISDPRRGFNALHLRLRPILETLIRENVKPQESELNEEEHP
jgi:hypothetical protein